MGGFIAEARRRQTSIRPSCAGGSSATTRNSSKSLA